LSKNPAFAKPKSAASVPPLPAVVDIKKVEPEGDLTSNFEPKSEATNQMSIPTDNKSSNAQDDGSSRSNSKGLLFKKTGKKRGSILKTNGEEESPLAIQEKDEDKVSNISLPKSPLTKKK
jgi:hypothetical protein